MAKSSPDTAAHQLEELQLLQSSLLPEEFKWIGTSQDAQRWQRQVDGKATDKDTSAAPPMSYAIRLQETQPVIWLGVDYSRDADREAQVSVQCQDEIAAVKALKEETQRQYAQSKADAVEHRIFDLFTYLQSFLMEHPIETATESEPRAVDASANVKEAPPSKPVPPSRTLTRVIFWSHHLIANSKRKDYSNWAKELDVWILLKIGWPGYLVFEGYPEDVDEIVRRTKGLQWAAITMKSTETYDADDTNENPLLASGLAKGSRSAAATRTTCEEVESIGDLMDR